MRQKSSFPNIIALRLLITLYAKAKDIPITPGKISERKFVENLLEALAGDKIAKESSINFVNKLRGYPYHSDSAFAEGIDIDKLDLLAGKVIAHYSLEKKFRINPKYAWSSFEDIFQLPDYLKGFQEKKYFKYLSKEQQETVDAYVTRKMNEIIEMEYLYNYSMYFWNEVDRKIDVGILQINREDETASIKYLYDSDGTWITKSVQRTDKPNGGMFHLTHSTLYINTIEEDDNKSHLRTSLCLSVQDSDFYTLKLIKGTYSTSRQNGIRPVAGVLLLERQESFIKANSAITGAIDPKIHFELIQKRIAVYEDKIRSSDDFATRDIFRVVQQIKGAYWYAFIKQKDPQDRSAEIITRGICFIEANGMVTSQISDSDIIIYGRIDNTVFHGNNIVCFSNYFENESDSFKYTYYLELLRDKQTRGRPVKDLFGIYAGITHDGRPRGGQIIFHRIDKEINGFKELQKAGIDFDRISKDAALKSSDKNIYEKLYGKLSDSYLITG